MLCCHRKGALAVKNMKKKFPENEKEACGKNERERSNPLTEVGHHLVLFIGLLSLGIYSNKLACSLDFQVKANYDNLIGISRCFI